MKLLRLCLLISVSAILMSCAANSEKGTIAQLRSVKLDLADEKIEGGIEKAMQGYKKFLEETPESAMTPEAMRRLADLKIEKEYGMLDTPVSVTPKHEASEAKPMDRPEKAAIVASVGADTSEPDKVQEAESAFEARTTQMNVPENANAEAVAAGDDLANQDAEEAIALYKQLLEKYPHYERNDQVLYQLTRAYEELGKVEEAVEVMNRIVAEYPDSRYIDEIHFRRGEFYFMRKKYLDAEEAYLPIVKMGESSFYYEMALYKLGWTYYKQDMHKEAMDQFVALLDYKISTGYDFENPTDDFEQKRVEDTHRVISLSFAAMGGPDSVVSYFKNAGPRSYEVDIYRNLGEYYVEKRSYADAASSYKTFVGLNPYHKVAPHFDMRVIEIYKKGGFPKLVIDANKDFATSYGRKSEYWKHFDISAYPDVLSLLKSTLTELANYYHALYQNRQFVKEKPQNFAEAEHWYHEFLDSFPKDEESPGMNYQLADLLLENKSYHAAALEYERTAYDYPAHEKSAEAGYAAVYTHRENLKVATEEKKGVVTQDVIRSSLRFAETFPQHEKAALVMGAALEDIFATKDYKFAVATGRKMLELFPQATEKQRRAAWLVVAHSSYELEQYADAEDGYLNVLKLTDETDKSRSEVTENLAASIYKQGEQANVAENFQLAADHFLRLGVAAPNSKLRPAAEYDAATALIKLQNWTRSAEVLTAFRDNYPDHKLQPDVTKKLAQVYGESGKLAEAAAEYERIERESEDEQVRRESLKVAADLYIQVGDKDKAIEVYRRFIKYFPEPAEPVMEVRYAMAGIFKERNDAHRYNYQLNRIIELYKNAGKTRTDRMRYLAGVSDLALTVPRYERFTEIKLVQPLKVSIQEKRNAMKATTKAFQKLLDYELGEVTAAATYYIAETYFNFSRSLLNSERPKGLDDLELEQYDIMLDDQSYPFEEKAIAIHEKNIGFIDMGIYNDWVDKSIARLAEMSPGRYARFEESSGFIASATNYDYQSLTNPVLPQQVVVVAGEAATGSQTQGAQISVESEDAASVQVETAVEPVDSQLVTPTADSAQESSTADGSGSAEPESAAEGETISGENAAQPVQDQPVVDNAESGAAPIESLPVESKAEGVVDSDAAPGKTEPVPVQDDVVKVQSDNAAGSPVSVEQAEQPGASVAMAPGDTSTTAADSQVGSGQEAVEASSSAEGQASDSESGESAPAEETLSTPVVEASGSEPVAAATSETEAPDDGEAAEVSSNQIESEDSGNQSANTDAPSNLPPVEGGSPAGEVEVSEDSPSDAVMSGGGAP